MSEEADNEFDDPVIDGEEVEPVDEHDPKYKQTFDGDRIGWENGEPVQIDGCDHDTLVDMVRGHGVQWEVADEIVSDFDDILKRMANARAHVMAREVLYRYAVSFDGSHFAKTPAGKAFQFVFSPKPGESLTDAAKAIGISKQAFNYHVKSLLKSLDFFTNPDFSE